MNNIDPIAKRLLEIHQEINRVEDEYYYISNELLDLKLKLADQESKYIVDGVINGKNEQHRNAQLHNLTSELKEEVIRIEKQINFTRPRLYALKNEQENLRYFIRLMELNMKK